MIGQRTVNLSRQLVPYLLFAILLDAWCLSGLLKVGSLPGSIGSDFGGIDARVQLALLGVGWVVLGAMTLRAKPKGAALVYVFASVALLGSLFASAMQQVSDPVAGPQLREMLWALMLGYGVTLPTDRHERVVDVMIAGSAVLATVSLGLFLGGQSLIHSGATARAAGPFSDTNSLALILAVSLPVSIERSLSTQGLARLAYIFASSMIFGCLITTWMRVAFVACAIAIGWLLYSKGHGKQLSAFAACILLPLVLVTGVVRSRGDDNARSTARSNEGHLQAWSQGAKIFAQHPVTGVGFGALAVQISHRPDGKTPARQLIAEPKSVYLQLADCLGITGVLIACAWVYVCATLSATALSSHAPAVQSMFCVVLVLGVFDTVVLGNRFSSNLLLGALSAMIVQTSSGNRLSATSQGAT